MSEEYEKMCYSAQKFLMKNNYNDLVLSKTGPRQPFLYTSQIMAEFAIKKRQPDNRIKEALDEIEKLQQFVLSLQGILPQNRNCGKTLVTNIIISSNKIKSILQRDEV
jgi:hypothetical protein